MKLTMIAVGSRGDVQPIVALGKGLQWAGYSISIVTLDSFEDFVRGLALIVQLPVPGGRRVGRVQDGLVEERVGHRGIGMTAMGGGGVPVEPGSSYTRRLTHSTLGRVRNRSTGDNAGYEERHPAVRLLRILAPHLVS